MADPQGLATFPGVNQIVEANYTRSSGITPGVACLTIAPQRGFEAAGGTLTFTYGGVAVVTLADCKVDKHSFERNSSGEIWRLAIWDRRWKWAFGSISGSYNLPDGDKLWKARERTPAQLCALCLEAMGESGYDLSKVPVLPRPLVEWDGDNPAQVLAQLAEQLGCQVVLKLDGKVAILPWGVGNALPDGPILEDSLTIDPPERPQTTVVRCGPTIYQCDFGLRAVGLDNDEQIKFIDDLSYAPANGWAKTDVDNFMEVDDEEAYSEDRELAVRTVYRWYRITTTADQLESEADQPLKIPGYGELKDGWQILPILDEQAQTFEDAGLKNADEDNDKKRLPAKLYGVVSGYIKNLHVPNVSLNTEAGTRLEGLQFRIIKDLGIVEFDQRVFRTVDLDDGMDEAQLVLRTGFHIRDATTWALDRYERKRITGDPSVPTPPRVLRHDEVVRKVWANYTVFPGLGRWVLDGYTTNDDEINAVCDAILDCAEREYQTTLPQERTYAGLLPISPDGAIQQVTWQIGGSGATTRASRNNEFSKAVSSYQTRRKAENLRADAVQRIFDRVRQAEAAWRDPMRGGG